MNSDGATGARGLIAPRPVEHGRGSIAGALVLIYLSKTRVTLITFTEFLDALKRGFLQSKIFKCITDRNQKKLNGSTREFSGSLINRVLYEHDAFRVETSRTDVSDSKRNLKNAEGGN